MSMYFCSLVRGPGVSGEITVNWKILPPSRGEFVETSGQLTMLDGQTAATVVIQVPVQLPSVIPCVCVYVHICGYKCACVCACVCVCNWREFTVSMAVSMDRTKWLFFLNLLQALNDDIPEEKCHYEFQLTEISEGRMLHEASVSARITMVASDAPYGRFSFSHEQLHVSEAAQRVWCGLLKLHLLLLVWGAVLKMWFICFFFVVVPFLKLPPPSID